MAQSDKNAGENKKPSALAQLAAIPKLSQIAVGFGSSDIGLGYAHNYALDIAHDVVRPLQKEEKVSLLSEILAIFDKWKYEHGTPRGNALSSGLSGLFGATSDISEGERLKAVKNLDPWQCHPYATTPVALFSSLFDYKPLTDYFEGGKWSSYDHIKALLILISHNHANQYQTSDCILAAIELAKSRLKEQEDLIKGITPLVNATLAAKYNSKETRRNKKEEKEKREDDLVQKTYDEFCPDGVRIPAVQQHIIRRTGLKQTVVSKSMGRLKLATRKSRKELG